MNTAYSPINCDVYDMLEEISTLRHNCKIVYVAGSIVSNHKAAQGRITNLYAHHGEEFLVLTASAHDAEEVKIHLRLDSLVSVNGINTCVQDACELADISKELLFIQYRTHFYFSFERRDAESQREEG
jgi:transcriptional antiterminator Rof (Rho-off)